MVKVIPWRLIGIGLLIILALAGANHFAASIPFTPQWSAKRAEAKVERLEGDVSSLERAAQGQAQIGQAVETYHTREVVIRDITARAETEARNAPDANIPLASERGDRLRAADDRLCLSAPALCPAPDAP